MVGLCERFHKLPSEVLAEDVEMLRMVRIADMGRREESEEEVIEA